MEWVCFLSWGFHSSSAGEQSACNAGDPGLIPGLGRFCWRRDRLPTPVFLGFPCGSAGKESTCNAGDLGLITELGRCPGEGNGYLLPHSGLENSMECVVHGVTTSWTRLSDTGLVCLKGAQVSFTVTQAFSQGVYSWKLQQRLELWANKKARILEGEIIERKYV